MKSIKKEIMEEYEKEFVKPYWENHNGVRFDEPSLTWSSNDTELIRRQKAFLSLSLTRIEEAVREEMLQNIGQLRQWLNEDRITDSKKMVTNEQILLILSPSEEKEPKKEKRGR